MSSATVFPSIKHNTRPDGEINKVFPLRTKGKFMNPTFCCYIYGVNFLLEMKLLSYIKKLPITYLTV